MGWLESLWMTKRAKYIKKMETALFVFIMKFDFNLNTNPLMSIESRFTRENTNDLGEPIIPQVAHIIISEFKKFMFLNAIEIQRTKRIDKRRIGNNLKTDHNYIMSPFVAPPYLDRFWKLFILYNNNYEVFCKKIWWSFIDREDPRENPKAAYEKYWNLLTLANKYVDLLQPFDSLWPRYSSLDAFIADYSCNNYLSTENIQEITDMIITYGAESVSEQVTAQKWYILATDCINTYWHPSSLKLIDFYKIEAEEFIVCVTKKEFHYIKHYVNAVVFMKLPIKFVDNLMNDYLIDINTANRWILEYKKYLLLAFYFGNVTPSEQVDLVWHLHMTHTKDYREMCLATFNKHIKHTPTAGGSNEGDKYKTQYLRTLDNYKRMFDRNAPDDVWGTTDQRFDPKNFSFRYVNIFRLAILYSMKAKNPYLFMPFESLTPNVVKPNQSLLSWCRKMSIRKMAVRKNRRMFYRNKNKRFGWSKHY